MAGAPFEAVEQLATPQTAAGARDLLAKKTFDAEKQLSAALQRELDVARTNLLNTAAKTLPAYLLFASRGTENLGHAFAIGEADSLPPRNNRARGREQHLLLYLQRICTKNDTFSEFGPSGWGKIDPQLSGISFAPRPGVAKREVFWERWAAHALAQAMNADPNVFDELSPRLEPTGRLQGNAFVSAETGDVIALDEQDIDLITKCDGRTAVHELQVPAERIRSLAQRHILRCAVEVPALDPHAFAVLSHDVEHWRDSTARNRWLPTLRLLAGIPEKFCAASDLKNRQQIFDEARLALAEIGAADKVADRSLYSAANPIAEECFRECRFNIDQGMMDELATQAAPWIDLWRDSYAFIASRVANGLRRVLEGAPGRNGTVPLPAFLRACAAAKLPLTGPGLVGLAVIAFQEVKAAFWERLQPHAGLDEYELTADDCHVVRNTFQYPEFDEYTYPSADLQVAAQSMKDVSEGRYRWVLAELHPPIALLHHCMFWSCPDKAALNVALTRTIGGKPNLHFGFFAADFTAHTAVRIFDAMPERTNFVAPQRGNPKWRTVRPADAEVFIDQSTGDVGVREIGSQEYLGSFARAWLIPLGFHPFQFTLGLHTPRLRCGRVIVQRRTWTITQEEWPAGNYTGVSRDLVVGVERLRARKSLPRYVYIRPTERALRRSGAEGRDKDTKPVFIDLESYLFLEIFYRWLTKAGELDVTEMLPDPEHLPWREPEGRRTFELRTLIVPA